MQVMDQTQAEIVMSNQQMVENISEDTPLLEKVMEEEIQQQVETLEDTPQLEKVMEEEIQEPVGNTTEVKATPKAKPRKRLIEPQEQIEKRNGQSRDVRM